MPQTITQEAVRSTVEQIAQENLVWRRAFRSLDASNVNNDTLKVPKPSDVLGEPQAVRPGAEFPNTREEWSTVNIERTKWGNAVSITMEEEMDNVFDLVAAHVDGMGRQMAEFLDAQAYAELSANLNSAGPVNSGSSDGTLSYDDVLAGVEQLELDLYDPDFMVVEPSGKADLLTDPDFTRATDLGDDVVTQGQLGRVAGLDVFYSNTGDLGAADALIVDSDFYGYEATWNGVSTNRYEEEETQEDVIQIWTMKGWKAIEPQAAIQVDG